VGDKGIQLQQRREGKDQIRLRDHAELPGCTLTQLRAAFSKSFFKKIFFFILN
jgi:hypothetical protein